MTPLGKQEVAELGAREALVMDVAWESVDTRCGVYVLLLDASSRILTTQHVVFAGRPLSPDGSMVLRIGGANEEVQAQAQLHLAAMDAEVVRIRIVLAVAEANALLADVSNVRISAWDPGSGETEASFKAEAGDTDKCLVLGDLSRDGENWSFETSGDGISGAISDLATRLGVAS